MSKLRQTPADIQREIFDQVVYRTPTAENLRIMSVQQKFLDGSLYTIGFSQKDAIGNPVEFINRAYVRKNKIEIYGFDEQLLAIVGATHGNGWGALFSSSQFMTSVIATAMTVATLVWVLASLYRGSALEVPTFLSSGFLIILGYYFGKATNRDDG